MVLLVTYGQSVMVLMVTYGQSVMVDWLTLDFGLSR
jgi:hypothetical protein